MKIHTDLLTAEDIQQCLHDNIKGAYVRIRESGSRSRARKFDIAPFATTKMKGRRLTRAADANGRTGITYDEWGIWLQAIFRLDKDMIAGPYRGYGEFLEMTDWRYLDLTQADQHGRHTWEFIGAREFECPTCGAIKRDRISTGFAA